MSTLNVTNLPNQEKRMAKAFVNFNGTGTVAIRSPAYNVSSITDLGVGLYRVNFSTSLPDGNYTAVCGSVDNTTSPGAGIDGAGAHSFATTSFDITTWTASGTIGDSPIVCATVFSAS